MKKIISALTLTFFLVCQAWGATVDVQQITYVKDDSLYAITTTSTPVESLTFEIDSAKNEALIYVRGLACLSKGAEGYVSLSFDSGKSVVALGNDTLFLSSQIILDNPWAGFTSRDFYFPFEIMLPIDHDSTGVDLKIYVNAHKRDANTSFKIYNLVVGGLVNMDNDSI